METGISLVLPAYSEAENLKLILPQISVALSNLPCPHEILVIDSIVPLDNTSDICKIYNVNCISRQNGNSYGDAVRTGIKSAKYSKIIIMDSDGSHKPEDIIRLFTKMQEGYDVVIGSRYIKGGNSDNNLILKFMSYCVNWTFRFLFNLNVKDISNSFRLYDSEKLKSINLECNNFDLVEEILIKLCYNYSSLQVVEIPIYFNKRMKGESKRDFLVFVLSYFKTLIKLWKFKSKLTSGVNKDAK